MPKNILGLLVAVLPIRKIIAKLKNLIFKPKKETDFLKEIDRLGKLSAKYESNTSTCAVNALLDQNVANDDLGGVSYGKFQLSTKTGGLKEFLTFLEKSYPEFAYELNQNGGLNAAKIASSPFTKTWQRLAKNPDFEEAEYEFIKEKYFITQADRLKELLGFDVFEHSRSLQEVLWSVACQHGNAAITIFKNALAKFDDFNLATDAELIASIYAERSKVWQYFRSSSSAIKESVKARFAKELEDALSMLENEEGY